LEEQRKLLSFMNEQIQLVTIRQQNLESEDTWRKKVNEFEKMADAEREKRELLEKALNNLLKVWENNQHEQLLNK
jgi:hypothetical protein